MTEKVNRPKQGDLPRAIAAMLAIAVAALVSLRAPDAAAATRCTEDPGDAAQIAATRAAIDASCPCFGFESAGKHKRCAVGVARTKLAIGQLRRECFGTVTGIYRASVCGRAVKASKGPFVACVGLAANGKARCKVTPYLSTCNGIDCPGATECVAAADTNGDLEVGAGDSGLCQAAPNDFTDNGDGTITDNHTRLMWEKQSRDGSIHDVDTPYDWPDATSVKISALNAAAFAGHTDWRLPTAAELATLIRPGPEPTPKTPPEFHAACVPGCNALVCSCTQVSSFPYWSSSAYPHPDGIPSAWTVSFGNGTLLHAFSVSPGSVRAVRGDP